MAQPHPDDVKIKKEQIAKGTGGICKWCKVQFNTDSRLWKDKFGNWMHCGCFGDMQEHYRLKVMFRHIKAGTGGYRQEQSHPDIYGGTA